ncbi:hypothetical protein PGB90_009898 [Kerria lacca]
MFLNLNLFLQKSCRFNLESEPNLDTLCDDESKGITFLVSVNSIYLLALSVITNILIIFVAAWSDKAGKKYKQVLVYTITGHILTNIIFCLHSYFWHWPPMAAVLTTVIMGILFLGYMSVITFSLMYVCNVSNVEDRTMKLTIMGCIEEFCRCISKGMTGFLLHNLGFFRSYLIILVIGVLSWIHCYFFLEDISKETNENVRLAEIISPKRITESFQILFKKRRTGEKVTIYLLVIIYIIVWFTNLGEESVIYIFLRYKFQWNEQIFATFIIYKLIGLIIGTFISSIILSKLLKIHDGLIGILAAFCDTVAVAIYFFATEMWHIYLIPIFDIFHGAALAICVSFLTKFFNELEFGKLFSALNVVGILIMPATTVYSEFFEYTRDHSCWFHLESELNLDTLCDDESKGITFLVSINSIYLLALSLITNILIIFVAAWSDKAGKKYKQVLVYTITGHILTNIIFCLHSYFWHWPPMAAVLTTVIMGILFLGYMSVITFSLMYVCNVSNVEDRTMKLTIMGCIEEFCRCISKGMTGFLLHNLGFFRSYLIILVIGVLSWIHCYFFLEDISKETNESVRLAEIISPKRITESFQILFKKRRTGEKVTIYLLVIIYIIVWFTNLGEESVIYIFLRYKFQWNEQTFATFIIYGLIIGTFV